MKTETKIKKLFNSLRGVKCSSIEYDDETWSVFFTSECKELTANLAGLNCPICVMVLSADYINLEYMAIIENKYIEMFFKCLQELVNDPKLIDKVEIKKLNNKSKERYLNYVKFIRSHYVNGLFHKSAKELLDYNRYEYGEELYSESDELRAILEFNSPEKAFVVLNNM